MPSQIFGIDYFSVSSSKHEYQDRILVEEKMDLFAVADGVSIFNFGAAERLQNLCPQLSKSLFRKP